MVSTIRTNSLPNTFGRCQRAVIPQSIPPSDRREGRVPVSMLLILFLLDPAQRSVCMSRLLQVSRFSKLGTPRLLFDARRETTIDFTEGRTTHYSWRSVLVNNLTTNDLTTREPANDPQDLERLLVERENAGDVAGMTALFEPDAVVDIGGGTFLRGKEAIHEFFTKLQVTGFGPEKRKFEFGEQRPALICGDLALTSTRSRNGTVTSEVARRQKDGTWLWVIDRYSVTW